MSLYTRPNGSTAFTNDPAVDPATGADIDAELNGLVSTVNALDNANIATTPQIAGSKIDLATSGFLPLAGGDMTGAINSLFDGVFRTMRNTGNGRIREYRGSDGALWGISYNTYWTGSAWNGRDITDICAVLKMQSDGLHYYHAVSASSGTVPTWVELFHTGVYGSKTGNKTDNGLGVQVFDDFLLNSLSAGLWTVVTAAIIAGVNGVARITGLGSIRTIDFTCFKLGNHTVTFEALVKHGTSGPIQRIGLKDSNAGAQSNEVIFGYYASASNWWVQNSIGGVTTITDTGVAISTTAFQKIKFVATASSVAFYIDDVLEATHTTNIPTANMGILIYSDGQLDVDYVDCRSTSRV